MNSSDAREVLIAESLGDFHKLLVRIDAVQPKLEKTAQRVEQTAVLLTGGIETLRQKVAEFCLEHQRAAGANASRVTGEHVVKVFIAQTAELKKSAQVIFNEEVTPPLRQLAAELRAAIRQAHRPWDRWLTHAATAAATAALSVALAMSFMRTGEASPQRTPSAEPPACVQPSPAPVPVPAPEKARVRK